MTMDGTWSCKLETKNSEMCNNGKLIPKVLMKVNLLPKSWARIYLRVQTGDDWGKIIDREITILQVLYPFLHAAQIRGKVYKKFGIPTIMGEIRRPVSLKIDCKFTKMFERHERKPKMPKAQCHNFKKKKETQCFVDSAQVHCRQDSMAIFDGVFPKSDDKSKDNQNLNETMHNPTTVGKHFADDTVRKGFNGSPNSSNIFPNWFDSTCFEHLICPKSCNENKNKESYEKDELQCVDSRTQEKTTTSNLFVSNRKSGIRRRDINPEIVIKSSDFNTNRARNKIDFLPSQLLSSQTPESSTPTVQEALPMRKHVSSNNDYWHQQKNHHEATCNSQNFIEASQFSKRGVKRLQDPVRCIDSSSFNDQTEAFPTRKKIKLDVDNSSCSIFSDHSYSMTDHSLQEITCAGEGREKSPLHVNDNNTRHSHMSTRKHTLKSPNKSLISLHSSSSSVKSTLPLAWETSKHDLDKSSDSIFFEHSYCLIDSADAKIKTKRREPQHFQENTSTIERDVKTHLKDNENTTLQSHMPLTKLSPKTPSNKRNKNRYYMENISRYDGGDIRKSVENAGTARKNIGRERGREIPLKVLSHPAKPLHYGKYKPHKSPRNRDVHCRETKPQSSERKNCDDIHNTAKQPLKVTTKLTDEKRLVKTCGERIYSQDNPSSHITYVILSSDDDDSHNEERDESSKLLKVDSQNIFKGTILGGIEHIDLTENSKPSSPTANNARVQYHKFLDSSNQLDENANLLEQEPASLTPSSSEECSDFPICSNKLMSVDEISENNDASLTKLLKNNVQLTHSKYVPQTRKTTEVGEIFSVQRNPFVQSNAEFVESSWNDVSSQSSLGESSENVSYLKVKIDINAILNLIENSLSNNSERTVAKMRKFDNTSPWLLSNFCCEYDKAYSIEKLKPQLTVVRESMATKTGISSRHRNWER